MLLPRPTRKLKVFKQSSSLCTHHSHKCCLLIMSNIYLYLTYLCIILNVNFEWKLLSKSWNMWKMHGELWCYCHSINSLVACLSIKRTDLNLILGKSFFVCQNHKAWLVCTQCDQNNLLHCRRSENGMNLWLGQKCRAGNSRWLPISSLKKFGTSVFLEWSVSKCWTFI